LLADVPLSSPITLITIVIREYLKYIMDTNRRRLTVEQPIGQYGRAVTTATNNLPPEG
jgi:hypothetical protein